MKRVLASLLLLSLLFILSTAPAQAMPFSPKATVNRSMPYYLVVDITNQYVTAYRSDTDRLARRMICSSGKRSGTTPTGTFRLLSDAVAPWVAFEHCYIRYGKRITGHIWFHSILYSRRSTSSLIYDSLNRLGSAASAGCIRLTPVDAQWISYNCKKGTTVRIIRGTRTAESRVIAAQLKNDVKAKGHSGIQPNLSPTPMPTLSLGSNNSRVKSLNARLRSLGFYDGAITKAFSEETRAAVEAYQAAASLTATGEADSALQRKIASDDSITGRLTTMRYGDKLVVVKGLQRQLRALGYLKSSFKLTTTFDKSTRSAVMAFQTLAGRTPDGIVTPSLQDLLFSAAAPTPSPSPAPVYDTVKQLTSLRKYRSTGSVRLTWMKAGKQVVVLTASDGTWTRVKYGPRTGYALSRHLMNASATPTPGPTPEPTPAP